MPMRVPRNGPFPNMRPQVPRPMPIGNKPI